jgi:hypothetical protein
VLPTLRVNGKLVNVAMGRVLAIGFDPTKLPLSGFDPELVQTAIALGRDRFDELGLEADWCLLALDDTIEAAIVEALTQADFACVVIGGGIRKPESMLELFERTVNLVRQHAPNAAIAFNTNPVDTGDAALRWLR